MQTSLENAKRAIDTEEALHAKVHFLVPAFGGTTFTTRRAPGTGHCFLQREDKGQSKWFQLLGSRACRGLGGVPAFLGKDSHFT